jgi:1,4-dihydroxy-2-naphthoyl-CoA hydrolase
LPASRKEAGMSIWFHETLDIAQLTALGEASMPGNLGIEFTEYGNNWLRAKMPVTDRTRQPYGRLHGGASVALAETVGSVAAGMTVDHSKFAVVGMEINANHVRPVKDGFVMASATAESIGRTTQIWSIRIEDEAGRLVCISRLTMAVISMDRA